MSGPTPANQSPADAAGPKQTRTTKDVIATEDIGLKSGVKSEELPKLGDVQPDEEKVQNKH